MDTEQPKVLIVDDEKGLRLGAKRLLESEGYYVEAAENGTKGILLGTEKEFDLAVIDLKMPDVDGIEVLKEILNARPNTVCFIATAYASYDTAIEATKIGAFGYIPKPFTPEEFLYNLQKGYKQRLLLIESEKLKKEREANLLALSLEKSRLSTIINIINNGVLVINKKGEVVYFNNSALRLFDLNDIEIGNYILDKLPEKVVEYFDKSINSEERKDYSTQIEIKKNELIVEAFFKRVYDEDSKTLRGVVIAIRNITDFKKIELLKSQFVSMVAHELKTPVSAVIGFLQILLDKSLKISEEKKEDFLNRSVTRLKGLLELVNDLLDISRMELGTKQREIVPLDIKEIIDSTLMFLEFQLNERGIEVEKNISENLPAIKADQNEITRLFTNILSNAIKYNKEKGKIFITVYATKNYLVSEIKDTGIGLKEEEKQKLFQQFFRAKNSKTRGISGTGLGLSIVKQIVENYHGKIEVESQYEVGTNFKIFLPIN